MSDNGSQDLVYRQIIDNKRAMQQLQKFEKTLVAHEKKVQKLKETTARIEVKHQAKTVRIKEQSERQKLNAEQKAALKTQRLAEQTAKKEAAFEKWKVAQLRSANFEKLTLEEKFNIKRVLMAKKSSDEIKQEYAKEVALIRRRNALEARRAKRVKSVNPSASTGKNATAAGAASGGVLMGAMANPAVLAGVATVAGGAMAVKSGADDYKTLQRNAQLTGMDFNTFSRETAGMSAVSGISQDQIAEGVMKDINDRAGEFLNEAKFNRKTGQFEGGEGSIMANMLMSQGAMSKEQVVQTMQLDPAEFIKTVSKTLEGVDQKSITFAAEAFSSDLANVILGLQKNRSGYEAAKANATTFSDDDIAKAREFQLALSGIASSLGQIPLNIFKEFTNSLSPEALEMLGKLGTALGQLGGIFGDLLATVLNLVSGALNPLLDVINWLLEKIKPLTSMLADLGSQFSNILTGVAETISSFIKGLISKLPDFLVPDSLKNSSNDKHDGNNINPNTNFNPVGATSSYLNYQKPTLPTYGMYGSTTTNVTQPVINNQIIVDGQVIAESVVNTSQFDSGVAKSMNAAMVGGY